MINWPQSLLDGIVADVRFVRPIQRPTFPVAWDEDKYSSTRIKSDPKTTPTNQQTPPAQTPPGRKERRGYQQLQRDLQGGKGDFGHMHPKLKVFFDPLLKKFDGKVRIFEVMQAAGVAWKDMPNYAPGDPMSGRDQLCWDHTCGICVFGAKCNRGAFHLPGNKISDKFVEDVIAVLTPGVQKMMGEDYNRAQYQAGRQNQGYYGRDFKRSKGNY
jgi:hypothetical protein